MPLLLRRSFSIRTRNLKSLVLCEVDVIEWSEIKHFLRGIEEWGGFGGALSRFASWRWKGKGVNGQGSMIVCWYLGIEADAMEHRTDLRRWESNDQFRKSL